MSWTVVVKNGEAVAEQPNRIVAMDVSEPYRPRLWAYDFGPGRTFFDAVWMDDDAWRTDPRFAGIEEVMEAMLKAHPGLSSHEKRTNLQELYRREAAA